MKQIISAVERERERTRSMHLRNVHDEELVNVVFERAKETVKPPMRSVMVDEKMVEKTYL